MALLVVGLLAGLGAPVQAGTTEVRLAAELEGSGRFQDVEGEAGFRDRGDRQRFDISLVAEDLADRNLRVFLNGKFLGRMEVDAFGTGEFSLRSEKDDMVPQVEVGDVVTVRLGQFLVARGRFAEGDSVLSGD